MARAFVAAGAAALALAAPADARTERAAAGNVEAELTYTMPDDGPPRASEQRLVVREAGAVTVDETITEDRGLTPAGAVLGRPSLTAADFDGDGTVEVVLDEYTGGAHCCLEAWIYRTAVKTVHEFGDAGYRFDDVDGDGRDEWVSADPRFAAAFTSYASSRLPLQIWRWRRDELVDVTRSNAVRPSLRRDARRLRRDYRRAARRLARRPEELGAAEAVRAALAAHAADQCSLGRCARGLRLVDRAGRRGEIRAGTASPRRAARGFARDLRRLLARLGYRR